MQEKFGIKNYWRMYKARGARVPLAYFFENHLFDLKRGTDTHEWVPKEYADVTHQNLENGTLYMCSWTSAVRKAFAFMHGFLGDDFEKHTFIDIGSGKGKILILWQELLRQKGLKQKMLGVDYSAELIDIAHKNYEKCFSQALPMIVDDVLNIDFKAHGSTFIFYMFNPFDDVLMKAFLAKIKPLKAYVIYNNPVFEQTVVDAGFKIVDRKRAWYHGGDTTIFVNNI